ncbi:MAG: YdiU family protein [Cytophaga sp.]|nr:YdiU family protein [Undibacterium sp.]
MNDIYKSEKINSIKFENKFASLPGEFYTYLTPTPSPDPYLVGISKPMMKAIGSPLESSNKIFCQIFTGNQIAQNSRPLSAVYSGHQFGVWAGQLGDGRAILLGDIQLSDTNQRIEVQLKGAGITPYSRMGDGRAVLRSSIREFLCSEAMAGLGIPTSRALCITGSDQYVMRESPETTAVVTRLAPSFIRFGSFEHWYYNNQPQQLQTLADFVILNYFPELLNDTNPYLSFLSEVTKRTAELMAHWQSVGFMHGVMNTDNMSILGLTLDYGPFGFMESFDPQYICNHTDQQGRYSYQMQPTIGQWNCHALGQAILPLIGGVEETQEALEKYQYHYQKKYNQLMHQKFGFLDNFENDKQLFEKFFHLMTDNSTDFTITFRKLSNISSGDDSQDAPLRDLFRNKNAIDSWLAAYRIRLRQEQSDDNHRKAGMCAVNPKYILRNHLAQVAIEKAQKKDFSEIEKLLEILEYPYDEQPEHNSYAELPPDWSRKIQVSCSS